MRELGLEDQRRHSGARDLSPDSGIFTLESSVSLFSSASASVDRCSFASDVHDRDSLASEVSQHLAGRDLHETSSGPDSDPSRSSVHRYSRHARKIEKAKALKKEVNAEIDDATESQDSAGNSFSQALKECQDRRSRSEALQKKTNRRRPASLDLNNHIINAANSSPRFGVMKKSSVVSRPTGTILSPGTPNNRHISVGIHKGWSSERVPTHNNMHQRHIGSAMLPFNNGRTLPSKWEDAERWIFSPVSGEGVVKPSSQQLHKRPKSKSGPLGPPGIAYYSLYSPAAPMFEGDTVENLVAGSPFSAGVIAAGHLSMCPGTGNNGVGTCPPPMEPCMARSVSIHGCTEMQNHLSLPGPQDDKLQGDKDAAIDISSAVSRRDMATQMSPQASLHSSPERRLSFSHLTPSVLSILELEHVHSSKTEVRDVQVDEQVTLSRWSKKHRARFLGKGSENAEDWKNKAVEARPSAWEVAEATKSISKMKREEAKITAWENLQKAKAEAAIRKLEMKLEKKRSSSMDRIMKKLRSAQKKAQEMRSSALTNQSHQVARTSNKLISFRRTRQISSLSGCFTCHAF
ncbi:uncharacterized protein LOC127808865 isoform X2 [Diospyros lotus]|uniref:uncharacterized protein LOC127808865 isoform X2 n=1 Tax=Diospyros lotus TaxID=55363 RepID=UPI002250E887|nr:uncharacterized protein LOC127808865 isoform X2 [Diospyros lotus]